MKINIKRKKKSSQQPTDTEQLQAHCQLAWDYMKKHPRKKFFGITSRPRILLLGTSQSGKTTLLSGTRLSLHSPHSTSLKTIQPTKLVDWWVSDTAVFIDPASDIALPTNAMEQAHWTTLLNRIRRYATLRCLHHIILTIDLVKLLNMEKAVRDQLLAQLNSIQQQAKVIPVSLVISQCDKLIGFSEMFDDMGAEERKQIFGMRFSHKDQKNKLEAVFEKSFEHLVKQLKARLLNRMHYEQSLTKRKKIYVFPSNFSSLKHSLKTTISQLSFNNAMPLQGIYFTSVTDYRAYFIDAMLDTIINTSQKSLPLTESRATRRLFTFPIAAAIIFVFTLLWHFGYNQTTMIMNSAQEILASTPNNLPNNLPWLSKLNTLGDILETMDEKQIIRYQWLGLLQADHLHHLTKKAYQSLLKRQFTLYIKSTLLSEIQLSIKKGDKLSLFDGLKAYLSISESKYFDKNTIMSWYQTYWKALYNKNLSLQAKLQHHLFILLESNKPLWQPDHDLIKTAQMILQKLSLSDLAFLELQGEYGTTNVPIFSNGDLEGISLKNAMVPSFFSTEHFKQIFNDKIPHIGKILAKGNWVLGTTTGKNISSTQQAAVAEKIRQTYLQYYTNIWAGTVTKIHLKPATNYADVLQRINNVLDTHSNLSQLLNVVIGNAQLDGGTMNKNLMAVKAYLDKKGRYQSIQKVLTALQKEIQQIQKSTTTDKDSYQNAAKRFKQNTNNDPLSQIFAEAQQNPEPIRSWLNTIALSAWKVMLTHTRSYLNSIWQTIVLPVYHNEIENRYPIFNDSQENISLKNFNDFFGPNGTVGTFFIYHLQTFVDTTQNYWTWRHLNGVSLNIPQKTLNMFIRASIIQQMFFTDNHHKPSFQFLLSPLHLSEDTQKLTLNVGGQIYHVYQKTQGVQQFFWPGSNPNFASIQFTTNDGKTRSSSYKGPWSWFRLLAANVLQTTADPEQFTLALQSNNNSASFKLVTTHRVNPMVPGVIKKYRCPEKL